jgi:dephospho-CoA kinase
MKALPKLLIIGHGRHGKDTVCEILQEKFGYKFRSSSDYCAEHLVYPLLKDEYKYSSYQEAYADRHNHRQAWYNIIHNYCSTDHARLGREIFAENDIYCGLRNKAEFHAMKNQKIFEYAIWVDRSDHLPLEEPSSMTLEQWMADYTIDNNGSLADLERNTEQLIAHLI